MTIKAVLIDESAIYKLGLRKCLTEAGIEVIGEASNGLSGQRMIRQKQPDIVLVDLYLTDITGIQVCDFITQHFPKMHTIFLSYVNDLSVLTRLMTTAAKGIINKNSPYSLIEAIQSIYHGDFYLQPDIAWRLVQFIRKNQNNITSILTDRDYQILSLIARGKTYEIIADLVHVSIKTIMNVKSKAFKKLNIETIEELRKIISV